MRASYYGGDAPRAPSPFAEPFYGHGAPQANPYGDGGGGYDPDGAPRQQDWYSGAALPCLGFLSTSQALCVAAKALRTESRTELTQFALPLVLLFSASTAIRSWNPIAWAARPYKIVRCRGRGMSSPIADQCVSHLGESAMGVLMCCYTVTADKDEPRLYLWLSVLIAAVARAACWCGVNAKRGDCKVAILKSLTRPPVDDSYDTWKDDMPWLTLYFVLGPWAALVLYQRIAETPWLL
ncbi:VDE lipocalin domain-containing protein [Aureococcus anophagefferens]|nr:VDE lipocalin domain-containing protein [Aureococcus anophagefferens]